jgi:hypothetical protein
MRDSDLPSVDYMFAPRQLFLPIATIIFAGCRQG